MDHNNSQLRTTTLETRKRRFIRDVEYFGDHLMYLLVRSLTARKGLVMYKDGQAMLEARRKESIG